MSKRETVEEFLQRGGKITKCEPGPSPEDNSVVMPMAGGNSAMMTLGEGALYYSENRTKSKEKKKKVAKTINLAALPANLLKFVPKHTED